MTLDSIAEQRRVEFQSAGENCFLFADLKIQESPVILVKPLTFMNLSGVAVIQAMEQFDLAPEQLLIVYDDFQLSFGRLRIRGKGSDGGHNGMASIISETGTQNIPRMKLGIGQEPMPEAIIDFVLSDFDETEEKTLPELLETAGKAISNYVIHGITNTMNQYNR